MRQLGFLLLLLGLASAVVYFMNMEMKVLRWIDNWGDGVAWGIRGGLVALGGLLVVATKPKAAAK